MHWTAFLLQELQRYLFHLESRPNKCLFFIITLKTFKEDTFQRLITDDNSVNQIKDIMTNYIKEHIFSCIVQQLFNTGTHNILSGVIRLF